MKSRFTLGGILLILLSACSAQEDNISADHRTTAERFFRGVYSGDPSVVNELATEHIVISYPIFQKLFNSPVVVGRESVKSFIGRFSAKWKNPQITIHEVVAEKNTVVLVWSFRARDAAADGLEKKWGGISVLHFNQEGKIESEFGEESEPGPIGRLADDKATE